MNLRQCQRREPSFGRRILGRRCRRRATHHVYTINGEGGLDVCAKCTQRFVGCGIRKIDGGDHA